MGAGNSKANGSPHILPLPDRADDTEALGVDFMSGHIEPLLEENPLALCSSALCGDEEDVVLNESTEQGEALLEDLRQAIHLLEIPPELVQAQRLPDPGEATMEHIRKTVRSWGSVSWHDRQRLLDTVAKLQCRRRMAAMSADYQPPSPQAIHTLESLVALEREGNRLRQAPILRKGLEDNNPTVLHHLYHHYLTAVSTFSPGLWDRARLAPKVRQKMVRYNVSSLVRSSFTPHPTSKDALVHDDGPSTFLVVKWAVSCPRLSGIPPDVRQLIAEYLLPLHTLSAVQSVAANDGNGGRDPLHTDHAMPFYDGVERCDTVHDVAISKGCLALFHDNFSLAHRYFRQAAATHTKKGTSPPTPAHPYLSCLIEAQSLGVPSMCGGWKCSRADSEPFTASEWPAPFAATEYELGDEDILDAAQSEDSDSDQAFFADPAPTGTSVTEILHSLTSLDAQGDQPPPLIDLHSHQGATPSDTFDVSHLPFTIPATPTPSPPDEYQSPDGLTGSPYSNQSWAEGDEPEQCTCGDDDERTPYLEHLAALESLVEPDSFTGSCVSGYMRYCKWVQTMGALNPDGANDAESELQEELEVGCPVCLYMLALVAERADHAAALLHRADSLSSGCDFLRGLVNLQLGLSLVVAGCEVEALAAFRTAHHLISSTVAATWIARLQERMNGKKVAYNFLTDAMEALPMSTTRPTLLYADYVELAKTRALIYCSARDVDLALRKAPKHPFLLRLRAAILADLGQGDDAERMLTASIAYSFQGVDLLHRARLRLEKGQYKEAVEDLSACLLFEPTNETAQHLLGVYSHFLPRDYDYLNNTFYSRTGFVAKAACLYDMQQLQPNSPYVYCKISQFFYRLGSKRETHTLWCKEAIRRCPEAWSPFFRGLLAESSGDCFNRAVPLLRKAVRNLPDEYECHLLLAVSLVSMNQFAESSKTLHCALKLANHPFQFSIIYNNIGYNYRCCNMYNKALYYFEKSKEYVPQLHYTFFNPYSNASEILILVGEQDKALKEIERGLETAIEIMPCMLEELLLKVPQMGTEEVIKLCNRIKHLDPYNEFIYRYGAGVMWDSGRFVTGLKELNEGIELTLGVHTLVMRGRGMNCRESIAMALLLNPHYEEALGVADLLSSPSADSEYY